MAGHELLCAAEWGLLELPETVIRRLPEEADVAEEVVCVAFPSASFGGK